MSDIFNKVFNINATSKCYQGVWPFLSEMISVELDRALHELEYGNPVGGLHFLISSLWKKSEKIYKNRPLREVSHQRLWPDMYYSYCFF